MASYHITDNGPRRCTATVGVCPYAAAGGDHYADQVTAQGAYEKQLAKDYKQEGLRRAKYVSGTPLQRFYRTTDVLQASNPVAQAYRNHTAVRAVSSSSRTPQGRRRTRTLRSQAFQKRAGKRLSRALTPNARQIKKLLLVKYWMPDIRSNKWR